MHKKLKIGINGFGRIGRMVTRILMERNHHEIAHINDLNPDNENLAYLLKYDTVYGKLNHPINVRDGHLYANDWKVSTSHEDQIYNVDWKKLGVDLIVEATGVRNNEEAARSISESGPHVLITCASPMVDYTLLFGVNDQEFDPTRHRVFSTSICDANGCAPILKTLNDQFGIEHGFITTLHPWLSYQNLMDGPSRSQSYPGTTYTQHYPLGRSSIGNLIPKPTTLVKAVEHVLPELAGRLKCFSYRVPTQSVSSADMTLMLKQKVTKEMIQEVIRSKVIKMSDEPLTSVDYIRDPHSAIMDTRWLMVNQDHHVKVVLWYDNEWGYACRVADAIELVSQ